jgi:hypothetical protein
VTPIEQVRLRAAAYIDYVEIDSVIAAIRARSDGGES